MENNYDDMEKPWMAGEPTADSALVEQNTCVLPNYDKIMGVGSQSVKELHDDLSLAEKEMKDSAQWDTLNNFLTGFKQAHSSWFK